MMHVQSCCFADQTYCFFDVLIAVAVVLAKAPYFAGETHRRVPAYSPDQTTATWNSLELFHQRQHLVLFSAGETP